MLNVLCFAALLLRPNINSPTNIKMKITPNNRNLNFKRLVALHEAGHVLIIKHFPEYFDLQKVTMDTNTVDTCGYTLFTIKEFYNECPTKEFLLARIMAALGGHAAEILHSKDKEGFQTNYSHVTTGTRSDLIKAESLTNNYIELFDTNVYDDNYLYEYRKKEIINDCLYKTMNILKFNHIELQILRNRILSQSTISF